MKLKSFFAQIMYLSIITSTIIIVTALFVGPQEAEGQELTYPSVLVDLRNDPSAVELAISDLQQTQVNLGFDFPFYDEIYQDVWVTYTGVLNFQSSGVKRIKKNLCCSGLDLSDPMNNTEDWRLGGHAAALSFSIFGLWTDLAVNYNPNPWFKTTSSTATFGWYDIPEFYDTNNLNSFEIKLFDTGDIKFRYDEINIDSHNTTVGTAGDLSSGQYNILKYKQNSWYRDVPMVLKFNTLTGAYEDQYGDIANLETMTNGYSDFVYIDPCDEDPNSCDFYNPLADFDGTDVYGDSIYDFIPGNEDVFNGGMDTQCMTDPACVQAYDDLANMGGYEDFTTGVGTVDEFGNELYSDSKFYDESQDFYAEDTFDGMDITDKCANDTGCFEAYNDELTDFGQTVNVDFDNIPEYFEDEKDMLEELAAEYENFEEVFLEKDWDEELEIFEKEYLAEMDMEYFKEELIYEEAIVYAKEEMLSVVEDNPLSKATQSVAVSVSSGGGVRADALGVAMGEIQSSTELVQVAISTSNEFSVASVLENDAALQEEVQNQIDQDDAQFGGSSEITEESILEELLSQNSGNEVMDGDDNSGQTFSGGQSSFGDEPILDFSFGADENNFMAAMTDNSASGQTTEAQDLTETNSQTTSNTGEQNFNSQADQAFSTGGSITQALTAVQPDFSQFNVAALPQQEQQTVARAEKQLETMDDSTVEENLDEFISDMQSSGGFDSNQGLTLVLMGRVSGFDQYSGQLQDVSFYTDRGMPGGSIQSDRNSMLRMMGTDNKHEQLIAEQYK